MKKNTFYYNPEDDHAQIRFSTELTSLILQTKKTHQTLVLVCIGTDRATGDCLGPLVGHFIQQRFNGSLPVIYGNLAHPVHAQNLKETLRTIRHEIPFPYIIVIDASLGIKEHIGYVTLSNHSLHPGRGVDKHLPSFGEISVTGIVDLYHPRQYDSIHHTRLYDVINLAKFITDGLIHLISYPHL